MAWERLSVQIRSGPLMKSKVKMLLCDTYIAAIRNSAGSKLFRNLYLAKNKKRVDALNSGQLSCAVFVSWVLRIFYLIKEGHATVDGTMNDLKKSGWYEIKRPKVGSILVWERAFLNGTSNKHMGFYIGNKEAVSNSRSRRTPVKHHWTYGGKRKIEMILWNDRLGRL